MSQFLVNWIKYKVTRQSFVGMFEGRCKGDKDLEVCFFQTGLCAFHGGQNESSHPFSDSEFKVQWILAPHLYKLNIWCWKNFIFYCWFLTLALEPPSFSRTIIQEKPSRDQSRAMWKEGWDTEDQEPRGHCLSQCFPLAGKTEEALVSNQARTKLIRK